MSDFYEHKDNWYKIQLDLTEHKDNAVSHITSSERSDWNQAIADIKSHRDDVDAHVTDEEREYWNGKSDAHDHPYAPLSHVGDDTHVSAAEKSKWNSMLSVPDYAKAEDVLSAYVTGTGYTADSYGYIAVQLDNIPGISQGLYISPHDAYVYSYEITSDATFQDGITYYTYDVDNNVYTEASVEIGAEVPADTTYYIKISNPKHVKLFHTDGSGQYNEVIYVEPGDIIAIRTVASGEVHTTLAPTILTYIPFKTV